MVSLILLLLTYIMFTELRNLTGKIIINLAISLLLHQSCFFAGGEIKDPETCMSVAVLLHFFVLSSFTWMSVKAYDVHRIFAPLKGSGVAANLHDGDKKRLTVYCVYAWGVPAVIVVTCVVIDHIQRGAIGYGQGKEECFISQPLAKLYSFVVPVALVLLFNLLALGHTVSRIVKTRKETQQITNQRQSNSVAVICVKMVSVVGLTWILGIVANVKALSFLWYPYVIMNSLQGLFIFLAFAVSGRALELCRVKLNKSIKKPPALNRDQMHSNCTLQSTANVTCDYQDKRDTYI
ncbi:adhesion G-protein coupled receptor G6-like [Stylophora pistillata]|uniref:adhesion G-protein coupled receptor G6-like n=1 Tax=Stylophora pistillata TaxID=50429 RepID=UPI000C050769|nr:adhesion G-protein coupled receptor G6-like [Stylophora pistillata]